MKAAARITSRHFPSATTPNFLKATIATYDPATDIAEDLLRPGRYQPGGAASQDLRKKS